LKLKSNNCKKIEKKRGLRSSVNFGFTVPDRIMIIIWTNAYLQEWFRQGKKYRFQWTQPCPRLSRSRKGRWRREACSGTPTGPPVDRLSTFRKSYPMVVSIVREKGPKPKPKPLEFYKNRTSRLF